MTELDIMMKGMSPERQKEILERAERLEVYFNTQGVVMMKDKDEQWAEGTSEVLDDGESIDDFTKLNEETL